jgi:hypothetical protein
MGIYLGANELGGGGGAATGDLALKPLANGSAQFTDSNDNVWLKTGIFDFSGVYTGLPSGGGPKYTAVYDAVNDNMSLAAKARLRYQSLTNKLYALSGSYSGYGASKAYELAVDSNNMPTGSAVSGTNLENQFLSTNNMWNSDVIYDGTTHWQLSTTASTPSRTTGPYEVGMGSSDVGPDLYSWQFKDVTGGTATTGWTNGSQTITLSGASNPGAAVYGYRVNDIAATTDHFYITATAVLNRGWYAYNNDYIPDPIFAQYDSRIYTFKFTKAGVYVSKTEQEFTVNDNSGSGIVVIKNWYDVVSTTGNELNYDFRDNSETVIGSGTMLFSKVTGRYAHKPTFYVDNNGNFIVLNWDGNTNGTGLYTAYAIGRGISPTQYARGITTSTSGTQTGSNSGTATGPTQTSEYLSQPLYVKAN